MAILKDITESPTAFTLDLDIPGFDKSEITLEYTEEARGYEKWGILRVTGKNDKRSLERVFKAETLIDADKIEATLKNGVLTIVLPKKVSDPETKRITVK
jgi:HSP20 family protein